MLDAIPLEIAHNAAGGAPKAVLIKAGEPSPLTAAALEAKSAEWEAAAEELEKARA
jgi:3-methyladenine DNA glycosylase Mpg